MGGGGGGVLGMMVCACASRDLSLVRLRLLMFRLLQFCLLSLSLLNIFTSIGESSILLSCLFQTLPGTESDSETTGMELI